MQYLGSALGTEGRKALEELGVEGGELVKLSGLARPCSHLDDE